MTITGIVHGKTIELSEKLPLAEGQEVEVTVRPLKSSAGKKVATSRSAGVWADNPEMDNIMEEIQRERKKASRPEV